MKQKKSKKKRKKRAKSRNEKDTGRVIHEIFIKNNKFACKTDDIWVGPYLLKYLIND